MDLQSWSEPCCIRCKCEGSANGVTIPAGSAAASDNTTVTFDFGYKIPDAIGAELP